MTNKYIPEDWIETRTGAKFWFSNPRSSDVMLEDVASALSKLCRYNGHVVDFYSVAEHACIMSDWVAAETWATPLDALIALHHDDAEAYISDVPRPLKHQLSRYKEIEAAVEEAVFSKLGLPSTLPSWLKVIDTRIIRDERAQAMSDSANAWFTDSLEPLGVTLKFWGWKQARDEFLSRHEALVGSK